MMVVCLVGMPLVNLCGLLAVLLKDVKIFSCLVTP